MAYNRPAGTTRFIARSLAKLGLPSAWLDGELNDIVTYINSMSLIANASEWSEYSAAVTYVDGTSFTVDGNQESIFTAKRRIQADLNGSFVYTKVVSSTYSAGPGTTTVVVADDVLTAQLTTVYYGILNPVNPSFHAEFAPCDAVGTVAATDVQSAIEELAQEKLHADDIVGDFVVSGLLGSDPGASLTMNSPSGVIYQDGLRVAVGADNYTYTASKDTYCSVDNAGTITHTAVSNGAAAPALPANSQWIQKVVTNGSEITSVVDLRVLSIPIPATVALAAVATVETGVAFLAKKTGGAQQTFADEANVVLSCDDEKFDTHGYYDTSTYRFTPQKAGKYLFTATVALYNATGTLDEAWLYIRKNTNTLYMIGKMDLYGTNFPSQLDCSGSIILDANGSTDYFSALVYVESTGGTVYDDYVNVHFSGCRVAT